MKFPQALASVCTLLSAITAYALPQEAQGIYGQVDVRAQSDVLHIATGDKSIIEWKDFSIGASETVQFLQPSASSAVLNRVTGKEQSCLLGHLVANGKVYLLNPNGVVVGKDAIIRASDFLASTLELSDSSFLLGQEQLFSGDSQETIINYGTIETSGGNVMLIGRMIVNEGTLSAPKGTVSLAAGQEILLKPEGIPILSIRPSMTAEGSLSCDGKIEGLVIELQAEGGLVAQGINLKGSVLALNMVKQQGRIYLKADGIAIEKEASLTAPLGEIVIESGKGIYNEGTLVAQEGSIQIKNYGEEPPFHHLGTLDVSGNHGGRIVVETSKFMNGGKIFSEGVENGGSISIHSSGAYIETNQAHISTSANQEAGEIFLNSDTTLFSSGKLECRGACGGKALLFASHLTLVSAEINVSGDLQGGSIALGSGKESSLRANTVHCKGDTHLSASAAQSGNGGKIVVFSENETICYGSIEANGGQFGRGGFIEISSKGDFYCGASLSVHAQEGSHGAILLDPKNIIIDASTGSIPQFEYIDPNFGGGTGFGTAVVPLSTGNIVITKPGDNFSASSAGAVYLYDGTTAALISTLVGVVASDQVGSGGATALTNGNYVVISPVCDNGAVNSAGAVTFGNGTTGISGAVSSANSLVGTVASDQVGSGGVTALTNGNYVVKSPLCDNGAVNSAGAATFGNGTTGISGAVSSSNSLVGTTANDQVSISGVTALTNGNYVVRSRLWDNGGVADAGAATFGDGTVGISGAVSSSNSLVGTTALDYVSAADGVFIVGGVTALANGNYVVASPNWNNGAVNNAGAVTFGNGTTGISGTINSSNSLVGTANSESLGEDGVTALTNGNYVVPSPGWKDGVKSSVGAVTFGNGTTGISGTISSSNSLIGAVANDNVGSGGVIALTNGNYVVISPFCDNGAVNLAGAVTFGNGTTGISGTVSSSNSLVGTTASDQVGSSGVTALTNGNYVVRSANWDNGATTNVGAVTFGDGTVGISGAVSSSNSLVGTTASDQVGSSGVTALTNGNYVVRSANWDNGATTNVGAVTFGDGTVGISGAVSSSNSLVGTVASDQVGSGGVTALANGNYVVASPLCDNGAVNSAGAVTFGDGTVGISGAVSSSNSLVGTVASDQVGSGGVTALTNGNYVVASPLWDNGGIVNAGAATFGDGTVGISGAISASNSIVGSSASTNLQAVVEDSVSGVYCARFLAEGSSGRVRAGLSDPTQPITYSIAPSENMTIAPSFLTNLLAAGSAVTLQANNDITVSSPVTNSSGGAALTLSAGRSVAINENITIHNASLTILANDLLANGVSDDDRDAGSATLTVGNNVTLDVGSGTLTLSLLNGAGKTYTDSGNLTVGSDTELLCTGSGSMNISAQEHNVVLGDNALLQTVHGNLTLSAGEAIQGDGALTIQTTGTGQLILISDALFPTSPEFGRGYVSLPLALLQTGGNKLLIYTSIRFLNSMPAVINGTSFAPGAFGVDSETEKWATYYPSSSGIPFTIFYKTSLLEDLNYGFITGLAGAFQIWNNPWYSDVYFANDSFPPYLTPKNLVLKLRSLTRKINDKKSSQSQASKRSSMKISGLGKFTSEMAPM